MKRILIVVIALFLTTSFLAAQAKINKRDLQKATDATARVYNLSEEQKKQVFEIQQWRLESLAEVEALKGTDYNTYLRKRRAVQIGFDNAIERLLTEAQLIIHQSLAAERQKREAARIVELKKQGASKEEIERAILEIE